MHGREGTTCLASAIYDGFLAPVDSRDNELLNPRCFRGVPTGPVVVSAIHASRLRGVSGNSACAG